MFSDLGYLTFRAEYENLQTWIYLLGPFAPFWAQVMPCHLRAWAGELNYEPFWPVFVYTFAPGLVPIFVQLFNETLDPVVGLNG